MNSGRASNDPHGIFSQNAYNFDSHSEESSPISPRTQSKVDTPLIHETFDQVAKATDPATPHVHLSGSQEVTPHQENQEISSSTVLKSKDITNKDAMKSLGKVEAFFLGAFTQVFGKSLGESIQNSLGITGLEKRREMNEVYQEYKLGKRLDSSQKAEYQELQVGNEKEVMKIPKSLFIEEKKLQRPKGISTEESHETVAKLAVKKETHLKKNDPGSALDQLDTYSFIDDKVVKGKGVVPTSYILGEKDKANEDHLTNVYVVNHGEGKIVIRSGKIDSKQRADDFMKLIENLIIEEEITPPLRIASEQLNSFENEAKMIDGQHANLVNAANGLNEKLKHNGYTDNKNGQAVQLVHINLQSNRWVHATKSLDSLGVLGNFLKSIAPKNIFKGEDLSRTQNLDSWGTYVGWVLEDLQKTPIKTENPALSKTLSSLQSNLDKQVSDYSYLQQKANEYAFDIQKCKENIAFCKSEIADSKNSKVKAAHEATIKEQMDLIKRNQELLTEVRDSLKSNLNSQYESLKIIEQTAKPDALQNVVLMRKILGSQLGIEGQKLDRGQEGMMIKLLSDRLGVISAMNCKSGLDRTGIWHATKLALRSLEENPKIGPDRAFTLVNEWESTTNLINRFNARTRGGESGVHKRDDIEMILEPGISFENIKNSEFADLFPSEMTPEEFKALQQKIGDVLTLRKEVLKNLIEIGIPITTASTGVMGFKWNSGMQENLLPLNFLPSNVEVEGKRVRLVKYDSNGNIAGISLMGRRLLTKFQKLRGS